MSKDLEINNQEKKTLDESQEEFQISFTENNCGFDGSFLIKQQILSKINKADLSLKTKSIFKIPALQFLKRKNNIFYFVSSKELHVDIKDTKGHVYLPFITKDEVNKNLQKNRS